MSECPVCHGNHHIKDDDGFYMTCTRCLRKPEEMERETVLTTARDLITGDRAKAYGNASDNLQRIATMWGVVLGCEVTRQQVADCMIVLKVARNVEQASFDSYVDICGYAAIGWECSDV